MKRAGTTVTLAFAAILPVVGMGAEPPEERPVPTVLFVCEHGTVKSLLAKLLFEREAAAAGVRVRAESRGVDPDAEVPRWMTEALRRDGLDPGKWRPARMSREDLARADHVVSFDVDLPREPAHAGEREWDGLPSVSRDYPSGRDAIRARVAALVQELAGGR